MENEITINGEVYVKKTLNGKCLVTDAKAIGEKPWPQEGEKVYSVATNGEVIDFTYEKGYRDKIKEFGNMFKTQEEAQMHSLRIESLSKGFIPTRLDSGYERYWVWSFQKGLAFEWDIGVKQFLITPKFRTKEACQEWYDKYGEAWEYLLTPKNNNMNETIKEIGGGGGRVGGGGGGCKQI